MAKFDATIEIINGKRAIVTLFANGEWSGSSRIDQPHSSRRALYELGYIHASRAAALKGGQLDRYREDS